MYFDWKLLWFLFQVAAFGCQAFSILFDDIDPELSDVDQSVFASSACAQVSLVNDLYQHLSQPKFFFCPTGEHFLVASVVVQVSVAVLLCSSKEKSTWQHAVNW